MEVGILVMLINNKAIYVDKQSGMFYKKTTHVQCIQLKKLCNNLWLLLWIFHRYFATGSADALVSLWDLDELVCVRTFSRLEWVTTLELLSIECLLISNSELRWFAPWRSVIGPGNSSYPLDQSDAKLKPIATWSSAFSRALD